MKKKYHIELSNNYKKQLHVQHQLNNEGLLGTTYLWIDVN